MPTFANVLPLLETASADLILAEKRAYLDTSALAK
jgi:hypothetical protein